MDEEMNILQNLKKKEFMSENQNENLLELEVDQNIIKGDIQQENQTYKMIINSQNISNNEDFSIEDDSDEGEEDESENDEPQKFTHSDKYDNLMNNVNIEPIAEEDGEESKYMPTPQKPVTSKMESMKAVEWVKQLKSKEIEKRLDSEYGSEKRTIKDFKSADAQKPKATLKSNKPASIKNLPPKAPNRSSTSNDKPKENTVPTSYLNNYNKKVPSSTKSSSTIETPKSIANHGNVSNKSKFMSKKSLNDSKMGSESDKPTSETSRALMLYETPTVASKQKKQEAYQPEENLPAWGIQSINSKNILAKRVTSATTRSTVTPRASNLKRGKSNQNCTQLAIRKEDSKGTHTQKDIKIRKGKRNRSRQSSKNVRKTNTSNSNVSRSKLTSKDRQNSMQRLGISTNLGKKKNPPSSIDDEKKRIQTFVDTFFQSDANSGKFSDAEKRKFTQNFKKAFIESQYGSALPPTSSVPNKKLKALPAPPKVKGELKKAPVKAILPSLPKEELAERKEVALVKEEEGQKLGNMNLYNNAFVNNFNFITKKEPEANWAPVSPSPYKESDESSANKYHEMVGSNYYSPESSSQDHQYEGTQPLQKVDFSNSRPVEQQQVAEHYQKVSASFGESLPMFSSFVNMYGKSFANAKK